MKIGLNCGSNKFPCGGKIFQCYDVSQQCDGNKDCDTGKDEANCTGSQQLISAKHEIAFRFIQIKCNFNVVLVATLGLFMQLLKCYFAYFSYCCDEALDSESL